jgi:cytochrome d ubiquinol oxidase subunit II
MKFRSKFVSPALRNTWDWVLGICGLLTMTLLGIAVGNTLQGVPFSFDYDMRMTYTGGLIDLINPFGVLCGLVSLAMLLMHGAVYLTLKTDGAIAARARSYGLIAAIIALALFITGGFYANMLPGFHIMSDFVLTAPSNPLHKTVVQQTGALLANYNQYPWMMIAPALGGGGILIAMTGLIVRNGWIAMIASGLGVAGIVATAGVSLYPFILPSSTYPSHSLTVYDASSSQLTLMIMLIATVIFMPIILAYTSWVYKVLWGRVTHETVAAEDQSY